MLGGELCVSIGVDLVITKYAQYLHLVSFFRVSKESLQDVLKTAGSSSRLAGKHSATACRVMGGSRMYLYNDSSSMDLEASLHNAANKFSGGINLQLAALHPEEKLTAAMTFQKAED